VWRRSIHDALQNLTPRAILHVAGIDRSVTPEALVKESIISWRADHLGPIFNESVFYKKNLEESRGESTAGRR
jgi:hypothetical protein